MLCYYIVVLPLRELHDPTHTDVSNNAIPPPSHVKSQFEQIFLKDLVLSFQELIDVPIGADVSTAQPRPVNARVVQLTGKPDSETTRNIRRINSNLHRSRRHVFF